MKLAYYVMLPLVATLIACAAFSPAKPPVDIPTATVGLGAAASPSAEASEPPLPGLPEEAILILSPGNGSRLVGQVHVEGIADSTFEQNLVIQVVALSDGLFDVIAQQSVTIQVEVGQRGPFAADVPFAFEGGAEQPGEVRVFSASPRDGGLTHLATAHVTLAASGAQDIHPGEPHAELIVITSPVVTGTVSGGVAHVEGIARASFEQTLVVEVYDSDGQLIGSAPTTVSAPDYGVHGPFTAEVTYSVSTAGPGRIVVIDPSPAFGQTLHLASVEIQLEP